MYFTSLKEFLLFHVLLSTNIVFTNIYKKVKEHNERQQTNIENVSTQWATLGEEDLVRTPSYGLKY